MKSIKVKLTGLCPLMLNNPQTANPLNHYTKAIKELTSKRTKQDEDFLEIFRLKFAASWYTNKNGQFIVGADMIHASLVCGAKENKLGKKFDQSVFINSDSILEFPHKDYTIQELWEDEELRATYCDIREVGVQKVKIPTARVIIPEWSIETEIFFDETQLNDSDIWLALNNAGERHGIGTYRKRYGRYEVEEIKPDTKKNKKTKK